MPSRGEKKTLTKGKSKDLGTKPQKPFKKSKKEKPQENPAPRELLTSLLAPDDEPEFPRGGGSVLSRQEEAEARAEAEAEFEREERESKREKGKGKKKGGKKPLIDADDDLGSLFGEGISGKLPRFVE